MIHVNLVLYYQKTKNNSWTVSILSQAAIQTRGPHLCFGCKLPKLSLFYVIVPGSILMLPVP